MVTFCSGQDGSNCVQGSHKEYTICSSGTGRYAELARAHDCGHSVAGGPSQFAQVFPTLKHSLIPCPSPNVIHVVFPRHLETEVFTVKAPQRWW